jgi:meiotic recombination protein SPO11
MHIHRPLVLGLFDCDPDGIKILDVYRNGSKNLAHEKRYHVPEMKWLGLKPEAIFSARRDDSDALSLTPRDASKITSMLISDTERTLGIGLGVECRTALQWIKMLNRKAEIQVLDDKPGGMAEWLVKQIEREVVLVS